MNLNQKKCIPCEGNVPRLKSEEITSLLKQVKAWKEKDHKIHKSFSFKNFLEAMKFVNEMASVAETEAHHPDFCVHYNEVDVTIWTHSISGLSENDFILAAKLDLLMP